MPTAFWMEHQNADFLHRLARNIAGKQKHAPARQKRPALAHDCCRIVQDRQAVNLALPGHAGGLRPAQMFDVEMLKPRLAHLVDPHPN